MSDTFYYTRDSFRMGAAPVDLDQQYNGEDSPAWDGRTTQALVRRGYIEIAGYTRDKLGQRRPHYVLTELGQAEALAAAIRFTLRAARSQAA